MRIDNVTINLTPPSAIVSALLAALRPVAEPDEAPAATPAAIAPESPVADVRTPPPGVPAIGDPWPGGGTYAGIARGRDGEPDGHLVLLDDAPEDDLTWADAIAWAQSIGDGARLPTRFESALLYANLQDRLDTERWHWTGTQYSDADAWGQNFYNGGQGYYYKSYEARARAVRRFPA